jgi:pimeloyl-ACP methyl ester carboxylesterase
MRRALLGCLVWGMVLGLVGQSGCSDDSGTSPQDAAVDGVGVDGGDAAPDGPGLYPNKPGGNPLVPEVAAYPYPSDFYLVDDSTTKTGRRVEFPEAALPAKLPPRAINGADGFSRITPILAFLPGGVDPTTLPPAQDPAASIAKGASVALLDADSGERVPVLAEVDMASASDSLRAVILRPLRSLEPNRGYVVVLTTKLETLDGKAHTPNPAMKALLDGTPTGVAAIEDQRKSFELVKAALGKAGIAKADVALAWSFHTRSEEQTTGPLLAMQDLAMKAPLGAYTIKSDSVDTNNNRQIVATFKGPNFIEPTSQKLVSENGVPKQFGEFEIEFALTIPASVDGPRPVVLYGHGFLGSWKEGTRGSWNKLCRDNKFSSIGTYFGFNDTMTTMLLQTLTSDLGEVGRINAAVLQTFVNYTMLSRLLREKLAQDIEKDVSGTKVKQLDAQEVSYLGISNGGTFGFVVAATLPELERASLVVGGGGLIHFMQRSVVWNGYQPLFELIFKDPRELQLVLAVAQTALDPIDSMNYAPRLVENRFPGRKAMTAAVHIAINDSQVDNLVSEWVLRSAKVPVITPSPKNVWGVDTIAAPSPGGAPAGTKAAAFIYDEKVTPNPPGNVPPKTDNRTHNTLRDLSVYQQHVATFIETGTFVQVCSGPCDPD